MTAAVVVPALCVVLIVLVVVACWWMTRQSNQVFRAVARRDSALWQKLRAQEQENAALLRHVAFMEKRLGLTPVSGTGYGPIAARPVVQPPRQPVVTRRLGPEGFGPGISGGISSGTPGGYGAYGALVSPSVYQTDRLSSPPSVYPEQPSRPSQPRPSRPSGM